MAAIVKKGINSFKFFMAYKGALMVGDELLLDGMQRCKELGALAMVRLLPKRKNLLPIPVSRACYPCTLKLLGIHVKLMQIDIWRLPQSSYHLAMGNCDAFTVQTEGSH